MTKKQEDSSLFQRLTRLFRSGGKLRRKVKTSDTLQAVPDKTKSSGVLLFQKSMSPTYATVTSNAYNLSERLMRYQDFQEMEYCLHGDQLIATPEDPSGFKKIRDLAEECANDPDKRFIVYSYDHNKKQIVPALGKQARQTRVDHAWKVTFDSGKSIIGSANHRLMLRDGVYCKIEDLKIGDALMPFYAKDLFQNANNGRNGYRWIYTMDSRFRGWTKEHQLIAEMKTGRQLQIDEVVHHINFVKSDNRPENLCVMKASEHSSLHAKINNEHKWCAENQAWIDEFKVRHSQYMRDNNPALRRDITFGRILETCERIGFNSRKLCEAFDTDINVIKRRLRAAGFKDFQTFATAYVPNWKNNGFNNVSTNNPRYDRTLTFESICSAYTKGMSLQQLTGALHTTVCKIVNRIKFAGFESWDQFVELYENHKVVNVEYFGEIPLFDLTVDGFKNFATDSVISHNTAELASALDIYADESVPQDDKGRVLHIHSENEKIKEILEDLFYNVLNISFNGRPWVRNLCKYGCFFLYLDVSPEYGVMNAFPIPVNEIEREENYDREDPFAVRFRWVTLGNKTLENWEVAHFRLLGNDMFLPYGSSVLEPARRIWRQLILAEDAMLVYRVVRAPERRVFYIDVGNIPADEVDAYMEKQKTQLRSSSVVENTTGKQDLRYNPMPVHKETPIPLLDGRTITIEQLAHESMSKDSGREIWVYSVQDCTNKLVPGRVTWCGKNYVATKLTKVWLDDGSYVTTAPEHPFVMRDGSKKRADQLSIGDSLMPLYRRETVKGYEETYDPSTNEYVKTHKLVASDVYANEWKSTKARTVHHSRPWEIGNKKNNHPDNLRVMSIWEHRKWHCDQLQYTLHRPEVLAENATRLIAWNKSDKKKQRVSFLNKQRNSVAAMTGYNGSQLHASHNENRREGQLNSWATNKETRKIAMKWVIPDEFFVIGKQKLQDDPTLNRQRFHAAMMTDPDVIKILKTVQTTKRDISKMSEAVWLRQLKENSGAGFDAFKKSTLKSDYVRCKNHSVANVEFIDVPGEDVYCMSVVGPNGEDDRHTFAVCGLKPSTDGLTNVVQGNGIIIKNSIEEDYFIAVRGGDTGTKIDTLAGGQNAAAVEDVEYIQKKMIAAIKIPRAYLGYDDMLSSKATLAQEDIRFARTINSIQKTVVAEFNKIAIIHLFAHGYDGEDLMNFTLRLTNPSSIAEQQKLELWRARFDIAGTAPDGMLSKRWIGKTILNLTDSEIREIREDIVAEGGEADAEGGGGGGGGGGGLFGGGGGDLGAGEEAEAGGEEAGGEEAAPEETEETEGDVLKSSDDRSGAPIKVTARVKLPSENGYAGTGTYVNSSDDTPSRERPTDAKSKRHSTYVNREKKGPDGGYRDFEGVISAQQKVGNHTDMNSFKTLFGTKVSRRYGESVEQPERTMLAMSPDMISLFEKMSRVGFGRKAASIQRGTKSDIIRDGVDIQDEIDAGAGVLLEDLDIVENED